MVTSVIFVSICVSPGSFYWRMVVRDQGLALGGLIASRPSQWTELGNTLVTHMHTHVCVFASICIKTVKFYNTFDSNLTSQSSF